MEESAQQQKIKRMFGNPCCGCAAAAGAKKQSPVDASTTRLQLQPFQLALITTEQA
jgi:hypothetical protein